MNRETVFARRERRRGWFTVAVWKGLAAALRIGWTPPTPPNTGPAGNIGGEELPHHYAPEPLRGYRSWFVVNSPEGVLLRSVYIPYLWTAGEQTAACHPMDLFQTAGQHEAPDIEHSCGFYCQLPDHPLSEWSHLLSGRAAATGSVAMWGRIIQCERGFKAQHVLIESPLVLELSCESRCDQTPVSVSVTQSAIWTHCQEHTPIGDPYATVVPLTVWIPLAQKQLSERYGVEVLSWM